MQEEIRHGSMIMNEELVGHGILSFSAWSCLGHPECNDTVVNDSKTVLMDFHKVPYKCKLWVNIMSTPFALWWTKGSKVALLSNQHAPVK
jgi:hypothetical protein